MTPGEAQRRDAADGDEAVADARMKRARHGTEPGEAVDIDDDDDVDAIVD